MKPQHVGKMRLPPSGHVARYCSGGKIDGQEPTTKAFEDSSDEVSVNHLEWFCDSDLEKAIAGLQQFKLDQENFTTRPSGRFAVLSVGEIEEKDALVIDDPKDYDPSHSLVLANEEGDDQMRKLRSNLVLLAKKRRLYPALPG